MSAQIVPLEVFYSYAYIDEPFCNKLENHLGSLRREGLITTWYQRQVIPGMDWEKIVDRHLNTASIILLLISADFVASDYCYGTEVKVAMERHETGEARVIPVLLRPVDWRSAPFGKLQALPGNGTPITKWRNRDAAFADVAQGIRAALQEVQRLAISTPRMSFPRIWNIPYPRNPVFTGREEILSQIKTQLQAGQATTISQAQALSGLGGVGKTQVAVEYAYQHHQDYQAVFWTLADTRESLVSGYITIAELLNLPEKNEQEQAIIVKAVLHWLTTHTEWLLILDNADDLAVVREFVPPVFVGCILLTTRAQAMGRLAHGIEIDTMPTDIGALFLLRRALYISPDASLQNADTAHVATAREICKELGGLPLALDQAGAYIEEVKCSLQDYRERYRTRRTLLLKRRGGLVADHPEPVATTWSLSFEKVEQRSPVASDLLRLCAWLHPDAIPIELIMQGASSLGSLLAALAEDEVALDEAIAILGAYSLIRRDAKEKTLSIHRLVQAVLQDAQQETERRLWAERAMLAINATFPHPVHETWGKCERLLTQALAGARITQVYQITSKEAARLLYECASYLQDRTRYAEAEPLYQRALHIREQVLGPEHPELASPLNGLAELYREQGKYAKAEPLYQRALHIREQVLGPKCPQVVSPLNNLAKLYTVQGKYAEAESLYQRALHICKQAPGLEHVHTKQVRDNYDGLLRAMKRNVEARKLEEQE